MKLTLAHGDREYEVEVLADGRVRVGDRIVNAVRGESDSVRVDGTQAWIAVHEGVRWVFCNGRPYTFTERGGAGDRRGADRRPRPRQRGAGGELSAPMPATVRRLLVAPGDRVKAGDSLLILEAMKMELPVRAPAAGTVRAILCREGDLVQPGVALVTIE
ncbi:MAG TPA: biotin/lipoyl-containing protein [Vicinamibacterales bacterium]